MNVILKFKKQLSPERLQKALKLTPNASLSEYDVTQPLESIIIRLDPWDEAAIEIRTLEDGEIAVIHHDRGPEMPEIVLSVKQWSPDD